MCKLDSCSMPAEIIKTVETRKKDNFLSEASECSNEQRQKNEQQKTSQRPPHLRISCNLNDYEVIEDIGRGQFGLVQKIRLKNDSNYVLVWKRIQYSHMHENEKRQLTQEVQLLQALNHKNVVRYCGKINDSARTILYLVMEYCDGGDLGRYLDHTVKKGHYLPEDLVLSWYRQLVDALHFCHNRPSGKVLHRDLKPQNILLTHKYKKLKLADFGLAKMLNPTQAMAQTHVGTPYYMSPEMLNRCQYDEKSDMWSLGCLISPFGHAASYQDLRRMVDEGGPREKDFPELYDQEVLNTIKWMLSNNPEDRPTTHDLKDSVLYKWAYCLQYRELSELLSGIVERQKKELLTKANQIERLQIALQEATIDFSFLEECVTFQRESDAAIKRSLKLVNHSISSSLSSSSLKTRRESLQKSDTDLP